MRSPMSAPRLRRKSRKLAAVPYPTAEETRYRMALVGVAKQSADAVRAVLLPRLAAILAAGNAPRADDVASDIERALAAIRAAIAMTSDKAQDMALQMFARVSSRHALKFAEAYDGVLSINPMTGSESWLPEQMRLATAENVRLIKSLPEQMLSEIEAIVSRGAMAGTRAEDISSDIVARFGVSRSRAALIARDQTNKWQGNLNRMRQVDAGVTEYTWSTSRDERVRPEHAVRDGKVFKWSDPPSDGHPGIAIRCVPGNMPISLLAGVDVAYRRRYSGPLSEIVTDSGKVVRCTPNHPVLTGRGWVAAERVNIGDYVFDAGHHRGHGREVDVKHVEATADQVFGALAALRTPVSTAGAGDQFHGDGSVDQQVDVIRIDRCLWLDGESVLPERIAKFTLASADVRLPLVPHARGLMAALDGVGATTLGSVSGFCKALALFSGGMNHSVEHRSAAIAWLNSASSELVRNGSSLHSELFRKALHALSGAETLGHQFAIEWLSIWGGAVNYTTPVCNYSTSAERLAKLVSADREGTGDFAQPEAFLINHPLRVVEKNIRVDTLHVYNFQTPHGWYCGDGIIYHNCRCTAIPKLTNETGE